MRRIGESRVELEEGGQLWRLFIGSHCMDNDWCGRQNVEILFRAKIDAVSSSYLSNHGLV